MTTQRKTEAPVIATWRVTGRGQGRTYRLATSVDVAIGSRFKAVAQSGNVTTGTLDTIDSTTDTERVWSEFTKDAKTATERAQSRSLVATAAAAYAASTAAYWASEKGTETMQRIDAKNIKRKAKAEVKAEAEADAHDARIDAVDEVPSMIDIMTSMIRSGMAVADAAALAPIVRKELIDVALEQSAAAAVTVPAPVTVPVAAAAPAPAPQAVRTPCEACGKNGQLMGHAGHPQLKVCSTCMTLDADTVAMRAVRQVMKVAAK